MKITDIPKVYETENYFTFKPEKKEKTKMHKLLLLNKLIESLIIFTIMFFCQYGLLEFYKPINKLELFIFLFFTLPHNVYLSLKIIKIYKQ